MNDHQGTYPRITLVTPSLNQGRFIEKTIQSVLAQNYPNLEYIVMDGESTDNTLAILQRYSTKLTWVSERDQGQTHAINKGLQMAGGEIVAYLNADDLLLPDALFKVARTFTAHPDVMWITGQCQIVDEDDREFRGVIMTYKRLLLQMRSLGLLLITNYISQPATFWRKRVLSEIGYFDESLHYVMDREYWLRAYRTYPLLFVPDFLAAFRVHTRSKTTSMGHKRDYIEEETSVIRRYTDSRVLLLLSRLHRWLMTSVYSIINRG